MIKLAYFHVQPAASRTFIMVPPAGYCLTRHRHRAHAHYPRTGSDLPAARAGALTSRSKSPRPAFSIVEKMSCRSPGFIPASVPGPIPARSAVDHHTEASGYHSQHALG
jgi:hypothetical protein